MSFEIVRRRSRLALVAVVLLVASACSYAAPATVAPSQPAVTARPSDTERVTPVPSSRPRSTSSIAQSPTPIPLGGTPSSADPSASPPLTETFPYARFSDPTTIDNPWLPLTPGTRWVWEGETVDDEGSHPHRIVMVVTDMTKVIDGVRTLVAWDRDFADGELVEAELVFLAQDDDGAVWHLGQYPEEYEDGEFAAAPGWIAGIYGSLAGYWMPANPRVGDRSYAQGWGPAVGWTDRGQVIREGLCDCVPVGCFDDVIVVEEWALDEPDARQLKYYAQGIGNIRVGWSGSADQEQETLELVKFEQLTPQQLDKARQDVLALEARAYDVLAHVYGGTEPMQRPS